MENAVKTLEEKQARVAEEYLSSLSDLNCNSKPLINMLTMLAEENIEYAPVIVKVVEQHITKVHADFKLPILYLIDSIVKNVKSTYVALFSQCIVNIFCGVFEQVNEKIRERMYALRQTWNEVFSPQKMYALDVRVKQMDQNWPITAKHPQPSIHVNPNFLKSVSSGQKRTTDMEEILHTKTRELLELKKRKLELELEATKKHLEEQEKQLAKTTESVIANDALVNNCLPDSHSGAALPIQIPSAIIPHVLPTQTIHTSLAGVYDQNSFRNSKLQSLHPIVGMAQGYPPINAAGKPKVHPVNAALLNTVRQRDPRLARQQQLQTLDNPREQNSSSRISGTVPDNSKNIEKSPQSGAFSKSSRSRDSARVGGKSPTQHNSSRPSGSSSSSNSDKEKERKRHESKSSSSRSNSSTERRKKYSNSEKAELSNKCDKDAFEIAPLSATSKRKSSSPGSSPSKSKDSKRVNRNRNYSRSKHHSRSRSPKSKDVDLRSYSNSSPENQIKFSDKERVDNKCSNDTKDLEKKNLSTALSTEKCNDDLKTEINATKNNKNGVDEPTPMEIYNDDNKKRTSGLSTDGAPIAKKIKSSKIDTLFGTEDVDLRQVAGVDPHQLTSSGTMTPPPPPMISDKETVKNWDSLKSIKSTGQGTEKIIPKKSSFDDVRAKFAKATRNSRFDKFEKTNRDLSQRFKLDELNMNEESQEANDEKIRTIITQAQELLEANSINQDQYKNLVQTVMSINEANKLKEAKRRELLTTSIEKSTDEDDKLEAERLAARDAILKKRIPKLSKDQIAANETKSIEEDKVIMVDDKNDSNDVNNLNKSKLITEKRNKTSKWGEKLDKSNNLPAVGSGVGLQNLANSQRLWTAGPANKRTGFRNAPHLPVPSTPNLNNRFVHIPWQANAGIPPAAFGNASGGPIMGNKLTVPGLPRGYVPNPTGSGTALPRPCNSIDNPQSDLVRTITIDGMTKEIRIYDNVAIVFMEIDQPREIGFQPGQRAITIDNKEPIKLRFNDEYKPILINGESHRIRFGFPSRELYIDDHWYEVYFGGPPVSIPLNNKFYMLKAEGPPPQVNIGPLRRDLVVGKINMIIDAQLIIPLFLDAKIQAFRIGSIEHTIQFADNLKTVLLNNEVIPVEYGGLPKSLLIDGKKYFVRFSALPNGVVPGEVQIKDMVRVKSDPLPNPLVTTVAASAPTGDSPNTMAAPNIFNISTTEKPENTTKDQKEGVDNSNSPNMGSLPTSQNPALSNINIDELFQKLVSSGILGASTIGNTKSITIDEKPETENSPEKPPAEEAIAEPIIPIDLTKPESIKTKQPAIIATLFSGMQCSSCGVRFPPEQTIKYSQHLDWHFRQNRRERDSSRKAHSRKWYYEINDWVQYEEIEDVEEREKNFFETQLNELELKDDLSNHQMNSPAPSCAAGPSDVDRTCDMCHEKFEQFYNEELEEWHLRSAIRIEDKIYHPLCYDDYKASLNIPNNSDGTSNDKNDSLPKDIDDNAVDVDIKMEINGKETVSIDQTNDDDDDVIVLPNEEPSITEIVDDEEDEYIPQSVTLEDMETKVDNEQSCEKSQEIENKVSSQNCDKTEDHDNAGSDVEIQEPHIPFTDLDTYVEKDIPQTPLLNVKIKEEPKDEDEDDGFEDVGTVLPPIADEISINSGEETESQFIDSSRSPILPGKESLSSGENIPESSPTLPVDDITDTTTSMDGNVDPGNEHNLSLAALTPAVPLSSLVNKIKINITKNIASTSSNSVTTTTIPANTDSSNFNLDTLNKVGNNQSISKHIPTISTIPVLCGGETMNTVSSIVTNSSNTISDNYGANDSNVSSIPVIGSYSASMPVARFKVQVPATRQPTPPEDDAISFELKSTLKNTAFKKTNKIKCGTETSGLCSIM